ncbi:glycosyl transferase family 2 [Krasilnikovia cinnamomea]|uniref:Glycosyl transferase family 2 n=1 Tax=Krasilnikovia cinnamomea TaxID=349313 RepID=A0A4Q7ZUW2_9ACTN|nr:glycosyltransferase family 2 protein [Krasilnikovia cinnamomea]RZU54375.1 glycosyl transferase family 2 [Krasilnikovia cinnamomea]
MTTTLFSAATAATAPAAATTAPNGRVFDAVRLWSPADAGVELTVVVPFYNPGMALRPTVKRIATSLRDAGVGYEVIAVSDGSTDGSEHTLTGIPGVRVITNPVNQGKGAALHTGFAAARGTWVGFIDADGDIDPAHLLQYLQVARTSNPAGVYADKRHHLSTSGATGFRKLISIVYSTLVTLLFLLGVRDSQTGCKIFRRDVLAGLLPSLRERRFAFDLEFFVAAKAAGIRDFVGAPVRLEQRTAGSTVGRSAIVRTIRDTFTIYTRLHVRRQYRGVTVPSTPAPIAEAAPAQFATVPQLAEAA